MTRANETAVFGFGPHKKKHTKVLDFFKSCWRKNILFARKQKQKRIYKIKTISKRKTVCNATILQSSSSTMKSRKKKLKKANYDEINCSTNKINCEMHCKVRERER